MPWTVAEVRSAMSVRRRELDEAPRAPMACISTGHHARTASSPGRPPPAGRPTGAATGPEPPDADRPRRHQGDQGDGGDQPSFLDSPATRMSTAAAARVDRPGPALEAEGDRSHRGQRPDRVGVAVGQERLGHPGGHEDQEHGGHHTGQHRCPRRSRRARPVGTGAVRRPGRVGRPRRRGPAALDHGKGGGGQRTGVQDGHGGHTQPGGVDTGDPPGHGHRRADQRRVGGLGEDQAPDAHVDQQLAVALEEPARAHHPQGAGVEADRGGAQSAQAPRARAPRRRRTRGRRRAAGGGGRQRRHAPVGTTGRGRAARRRP